MAEKTVLEDFDTGEEIVPQDVDLNQLQTPLQTPLEEPPKKQHKKEGHKSHEMEQKVKDLESDLLRRRAEFENYRKRVEQEKLDMSKYAGERIVRDLLPTMDSFERALHPERIADEHKPIYDGFALVQKLMVEALTKQGVTEIKAIGEKFDPVFHQAVSKEEQDGKEAGIVIKEYQKGYMLGSRVLRPSMVVVTE